MSKLTLLTVGLMAFGFWAAPVAAQQAAPAPPRSNPEERKAGDLPGPIDSLSDLQDTARMVFKLADENNDGQISQKEAIDAANLAVGGFFFRADQNGDGVLSQDEARAAREAFLNTKPWLRYVVLTASSAKRDSKSPNPLNANLIATLEATFDTNNDKQLQASELRQAVQTSVQGACAAADTNRDGQLSPAELNASVAGLARQVAQATFQQADTDNNGQISQAEFEKAIEEPVRVAFKVLDLNHDGQLSQQEAQTARQVVMSKIRALNFPEPANSPRNLMNQALGSSTAPTTPTPPASQPNR